MKLKLWSWLELAGGVTLSLVLSASVFGQSTNPITPWRFAFVGDTHSPETSIPSEIASAVLADGSKFLLLAGDIVQAGPTASPSIMQTQLAAWRNALAPLFTNSIPVYVIRGNHENLVTNNLGVWNSFFSGANAMPTNGPCRREQPYLFLHLQQRLVRRAGSLRQYPPR